MAVQGIDNGQNVARGNRVVRVGIHRVGWILEGTWGDFSSRGRRRVEVAEQRRIRGNSKVREGIIAQRLRRERSEHHRGNRAAAVGNEKPPICL